MEELMEILEQTFRDYRADLEKAEKKQKPMGGLLGFGSSLKDDACHEVFDEKAEQAVQRIRDAGPSPDEAERAVRMLLDSRDGERWPLSSQWMMRAAERHTLLLIPFLSGKAAAELYGEYTRRYKPWDRLPAQKEVCLALKEQREKTEDSSGRPG